MKTITLEKLITFRPCYRRERLEEIRGDKEYWTALDILALDDVPKHDRMWAVLRPELIDEMLLHEFACRCAERALSFVENPDPRSVRAIEVKRAWMRGEVTGVELERARDAARVAARVAARDAAEDAARAASGAAWAAAGAAWAAAEDAARAASGEAAGVSAWAAARAAGTSWTVAWAAAGAAARNVERQWQVDELKRMLMEVN